MNLARGANAQTPVITFVGRSGTGKTTFLEKLIPLLKNRGIRLAVIKHDVHKFEIDYPGKDTYRFTQAGADVVAISADHQFALVERREQELSLDQVISRLPKTDLIITEGYKTSPNPKIEIHRADAYRELFCRPEEWLAVMSDEPLDIDAPVLDLADLEGCADIIQSYMEDFAAGRAKDYRSLRTEEK
jgi:molybdopterin-guanine dinucleotide biosynthesis protein B